MEKIASFTVDHIRLIPGVYVSRKDIDEQVFLVGEVHVEAAPGDLGRPDDLVDRRLGIGDADKFLTRRPQQFLPFGGREIEERGAGHGHPSFECDMTDCHRV